MKTIALMVLLGFVALTGLSGDKYRISGGSTDKLNTDKGSFGKKVSTNKNSDNASTNNSSTSTNSTTTNSVSKSNDTASKATASNDNSVSNSCNTVSKNKDTASKTAANNASSTSDTSNGGKVDSNKVFKGHGITFVMPDGWRITSSDADSTWIDINMPFTCIPPRGEKFDLDSSIQILQRTGTIEPVWNDDVLEKLNEINLRGGSGNMVRAGGMLEATKWLARELMITPDDGSSLSIMYQVQTAPNVITIILYPHPMTHNLFDSKKDPKAFREAADKDYARMTKVENAIIAVLNQR